MQELNDRINQLEMGKYKNRQRLSWKKGTETAVSINTKRGVIYAILIAYVLLVILEFQVDFDEALLSVVYKKSYSFFFL